MIRKLFYSATLVVLTSIGHAQIDIVRTIPMEKSNGQSKLYLLHEDSAYRVLAPETAINEVLKPFKEADRLPLAFRDLNADNSTDYLQISKKRGLGTESQYLIHELLERGDCLIEQKRDNIKIKAVVSMRYKDAQVKGIKYYIGDHILYNYIDPSEK